MNFFRLLAFCFFYALAYLPALSAEPHSLKIGVISGLNGAAAKWGRFQNMGITLAQEEFNAKGWKLEIAYEDSETLSPKAISAFHKLTTLDHVQGILADDFGFVLAPLLPLASKQKVFLLALSLPHEHYCQSGAGYFYSMGSQFENSRNAYDQFFVLHPEVKKIALVVFDDPEWGQAYRKIWIELAKQHGVEIVETFLSSDFLPDFKSALAKIVAKKPDAIFQAHEPETFLKALQQYKYPGYVVMANNVFEMLADKPLRPELKNMYVVDPIMSQDFIQKFHARFKTIPILEAYAGYEGLKAMLLAYEKNQAHPEAAMKQIQYAGVAGAVDFTGKSCAGNLAKWGLFQFQSDGQWALATR